MADDTTPDEVTARRSQHQARELDDALGQLMDRDRLVAVNRGELAVARNAAAAACNAQRMLDLAHLRDCVVITKDGPVVMWADVERVMPLPQ